MKAQIVSFIIYAAFVVFLKFSCRDKKGQGGKGTLYCLLGAALLLRLVISFFSAGYETDMNCFKSWAMQASVTPPWDFYDSIWCDYPPGYLYILAPLGAIGNLGIDSELFSALIKLPACLCDVLCAAAIYRLAGERCGREISLAAAALYLFCPAVIINSALWGQVDSVYTFILICSLYFLFKEKYYKSALLFGLCVVFKMQGLMFAPIYIFAFVEKYIKTRDKKLFKTLALSVLIGVAAVFAVALPYVLKKGIFYLFEMYQNTMGQYPYASFNAFNFFSLLGANTYENTTPFMFLDFKGWGSIFILAAVALSGIMYIKGEGLGKLFYCAATLMTLIFTFASDMHERYLYPAMALYLIAAVLDRDKKTAALFLCLALSQAVNVGYLYNMSLSGNYHMSPDDPLLAAGSIFTVAAALYALCHGFKLYIDKSEKVGKIMKENKKITRFDIIAMALVTLIYAVVSFVNLGNCYSPETKANAADVIASAEGEVIEVSKVMYFQGLGEAELSIYKSDDGSLWSLIGSKEIKGCFVWDGAVINESAKYFRVVAEGNDAFELYEIGFIGSDGEELLKLSFKGDEKLFDEQETVPAHITYENGTYFDEIYHARTAYEHIEGIYPYEITHPPLGKIIIGVGMRIFGLNPFGWRVMGNIFGIMMLPLMYLLGKRVFKNSLCGLFAMLLMCFDFMHFSQTRIATIDSFSVFFIMLMYYLMYIYYDGRVLDLSYKKSLWVLFACGVVFGLGIATKWICVYAGLGLAVLYALGTARRAREGAPAFKCCLWCVLFFIVIPFIIYFASYYPYFKADPSRSALKIFMDNQEYMLSYHGNLEATHPFQTPFYQWPLVIRPIWFFGATEGFGEGYVSSIVSMGNPIIWWAATAAAIVLIFKKNKKREDWFIIIGYLSQYLPWFFVGRIVFIYHYFASTPFIILALVYAFKYIMEKYKKGYVVPVVFLAVSLLLFIMFYPVLSGMAVSESYIIKFLQWLPSWTFC